MAFTDVIISEKAAAMEQKRDVDFEQHRGALEELLEYYPCVKHIFWEPFLSVRDMYCALQIRADAFSGKHQKAKRITAFCEFGCASANKGGRREMDEQTFGTHTCRPSRWDSSSRSRPPKCARRASADRGKRPPTPRARAWDIPTSGRSPRG